MANLAGVDWNLFLVLHTVLEEGSATKAAKRLHVTQSAVSNALARLRVVFQDPLVVRIGNQLVPTARARALAPRIALVVQQLGQALEPAHAFDPQTSTRRFVVGVLDDLELVLLPRLTALAAQWSSATLHVVRASAAAAASLLATGELDVLVGTFSAVPAGCVAEELFEDDVVAVVRADHPATSLGDCRRIMVHDAANASLVVPGVVAAALILLQSDAVLETSRRLATFLTSTFALRVAALETAAEAMSVSLVWHARSDGDAAAQALRELVRRAAKPPSGRRSRATR